MRSSAGSPLSGMMRTALRSHRATTGEVSVPRVASSTTASASSSAPISVGSALRREVVHDVREGGCRDHRHDRDAVLRQLVRECAAVRFVHRNEDSHGAAPAVGTTDSADSSAMAARVAATSARGMTTSSAAEPPPIIESSRVTETTVASATRIRGTS